MSENDTLGIVRFFRRHHRRKNRSVSTLGNMENIMKHFLGIMIIEVVVLVSFSSLSQSGPTLTGFKVPPFGLGRPLVPLSVINGGQNPALNLSSPKQEQFIVDIHQDSTTFTDMHLPFDKVIGGNMSFCDYDNDGDLDVFVTGWNDTGWVCKIYRNDDGVYHDIGANIVSIGTEHSVAWGDFDNDGDYDLAICGELDTLGQQNVSRIYRNDNDTFVDIGAPLMGLSGGISWVDYDNDGDLDLFICGSPDAGHSFEAHLYRNDNCVFHEVDCPFPGSWGSEISWADYNNDGLPDLLYSGYPLPNTQVYRNDGNNHFTLMDYNLPCVINGTARWIDFNNDGLLDIALMGDIYGKSTLTTIYRQLPPDSVHSTYDTLIYSGYTLVVPSDTVITQIIDPDSTEISYDTLITLTDTMVVGADTIITAHTTMFVDMHPNIAQLGVGDMAFGDFDNDGDYDLALQGCLDENGHGMETHIYRNDNGQFEDMNIKIPPMWYGSMQWGDFDKDGKLDLLVCGGTVTRPGYTYPGPFFSVGTIYKNNCAVANTPPTPPPAISAVAINNRVQLRWEHSSDAQTPTKEITYNLRIGTSPGKSNVFGSNSVPSTGFRRLPKWGNLGFRLSNSLKNLSAGKYYWSVQSVDNAYAGSAFAPEQTFTVGGTQTYSASLSTAMLDFGQTDPGGSATGAVTVTNTGSGYLGITATVSSNSAYSVNPVSSTISPGASKIFQVIFRPSVLGSQSGILAFAINGTHSPLLVRLISNAVSWNAAMMVFPNWNLLSISSEVDQPDVETIFPDAITQAFSYNGEGYVQQTTLQTGRGYWLKFSIGRAFSLGGNPVLAETVVVKAGWNLIGSINIPLNPTSIVSDPPGLSTSQFFGYSAAGYQTADMIQPGHGYWVKVLQDSKLILAGVNPRSGQIKIVAISELPPAPPDANDIQHSTYPKTYSLSVNYPNPFNPGTTILYSLPEDGYVTLTVYNTLGEVVAVLVDGRQSAGYKNARFDARNFSSGLYFYKLVAGPFTRVRKMLLVR